MAEIIISINKNKLDIPLIHSFLSNSYWAKGRTLAQVEKASKTLVAMACI